MFRFVGSRFSALSLLLLLLALVTGGVVGEDDTGKNKGARKSRKDAELSATEEEFVKAINTARRMKDLKALKTNPALVAACREHANEMVKRNELADAFDGKNPGDRINGAGVKANHWGITNGKGKVGKVVKSWAGDPIADANILEPHVTELGIGVAVNDAGEAYIAALYVEIAK